MPTLHHPVRKKEKASTKAVAIKKARLLAARKAPAKKKARYARTVLTNSRCIINEDALDARLIREARQADRGKARFTVNELRGKRGLASI